MTQLVFRYTDGRIPEKRTVTVDAAKVHELLQLGRPIKLDDEAAYFGWCEAEGIESNLASDSTVPPKPVDKSDWPDGATHMRLGTWWTVTVGGVARKVQGKSAAIAVAWDMAG